MHNYKVFVLCNTHTVCKPYSGRLRPFFLEIEEKCTIKNYHFFVKNLVNYTLFFTKCIVNRNTFHLITLLPRALFENNTLSLTAYNYLTGNCTLSMTTCNYWTGCDMGLIAVHSPVTNSTSYDNKVHIVFTLNL